MTQNSQYFGIDTTLVRSACSPVACNSSKGAMTEAMLAFPTKGRGWGRGGWEGGEDGRADGACYVWSGWNCRHSRGGCPLKLEGWDELQVKLKLSLFVLTMTLWKRYYLILCYWVDWIWGISYIYQRWTPLPHSLRHATWVALSLSPWRKVNIESGSHCRWAARNSRRNALVGVAKILP